MVQIIRLEDMQKAMDLSVLLKILNLDMVKKNMNKGITAASKFNQSNYGKMLKNQCPEFGKIAGKKN